MNISLSIEFQIQIPTQIPIHQSYSVMCMKYQMVYQNWPKKECFHWNFGKFLFYMNEFKK